MTSSLHHVAILKHLCVGRARAPNTRFRTSRARRINRHSSCLLAKGFPLTEISRNKQSQKVKIPNELRQGTVGRNSHESEEKEIIHSEQHFCLGMRLSKTASLNGLVLRKALTSDNQACQCSRFQEEAHFVSPEAILLKGTVRKDSTTPTFASIEPCISSGHSAHPLPMRLSLGALYLWPGLS